MSLNSVEIAQIYLDGLNSYSEEQFMFKQAKEIWSLAEMYEHVYESNTMFFLANSNKCILQRKGQLGGEISVFGKSVLEKLSFPAIKIKVPEVFGEVKFDLKPMDFYKSYFSELPNAIKELEIKVLDANPEYKILHPAHFDYLNANEWLILAQIHMKHHLRQKKELESYL